MPRRIPRTRAGGKFTEARYWSFIRGALRSASLKYPSKYAALAAAKRAKPKGSVGTHRFVYICAACQQTHPSNEVQVDHIEPCGSLKSYEDLPGFAERLFCEPEDLQVLCKPCHQNKTNADRKAAKEAKK